MYVKENRYVRRTFCSLFPFTTIFMLCISGSAIFLLIANLLIANEKDTKFNTKDDQDKPTYRSDDDVTETVSFTNNLLSKKDSHLVSNISFFICAILGCMCLVITISVIIYQIYLSLRDCVRPVRNKPLVNFDADDNIVVIPMDYNSTDVQIEF